MPYAIYVKVPSGEKWFAITAHGIAWRAAEAWKFPTQDQAAKVADDLIRMNPDLPVKVRKVS